jgi:hypothetical protein
MEATAAVRICSTISKLIGKQTVLLLALLCTATTLASMRNTPPQVDISACKNKRKHAKTNVVRMGRERAALALSRFFSISLMPHVILRVFQLYAAFCCSICPSSRNYLFPLKIKEKFFAQSSSGESDCDFLLPDFSSAKIKTSLRSVDVERCC